MPNSTAYMPNSNDLPQGDADISTILFDKACAYDLNNELIMTAANIKSNTNNEVSSNLDMVVIIHRPFSKKHLNN